MTFEAWLEAVDIVFVKETGLGRDDFPDQCYHDWYDDGMTPREAYVEAMHNEYGTYV